MSVSHCVHFRTTYFRDPAELTIETRQHAEVVYAAVESYPNLVSDDALEEVARCTAAASRSYCVCHGVCEVARETCVSPRVCYLDGKESRGKSRSGRALTSGTAPTLSPRFDLLLCTFGTCLHGQANAVQAASQPTDSIC